MQLQFSFIIPVYNRPDEIHELLQSFLALKTTETFEIVIVEDGSIIPSKEVVTLYKDQLNISYFFKENTGPGDSRNFGMRYAQGNYFIILDSDCILQESYLNAVVESLEADYVDCYGGPDAAHESFTNLQKAINFSMTSFMTTGGIRGGKKHIDRFQPRSFNMGISKQAFLASGGFGNIHPGEDPDLSIRLWQLGFRTKLISKALVYHKRRISWEKFYNQVYKFGLVRPILNSWHPKTAKLTYWFPTLFSLGYVVACGLYLFQIKFFVHLYYLYFMVAFVMAVITTKNLVVAVYVLPAIVIQFFGYGYGFLKSIISIKVLRKDPKQFFPELFFNRDAT